MRSIVEIKQEALQIYFGKLAQRAEISVLNEINQQQTASSAKVALSARRLARDLKTIGLQSPELITEISSKTRQALERLVPDYVEHGDIALTWHYGFQVGVHSVIIRFPQVKEA